MGAAPLQIELLLKVTTLIVCKEGRKTIGTGTGFFFTHNGVLHLITNRHVVVNEPTNHFPDKIIIRLNCDMQDIKKSKEIEIALYDTNGKPLWKQVDNVDLAALKVEIPSGCIFATLSEANLLPDDIQLGLAEQVAIVGYPKGFYDEVHNLPIVRNGTIASAYGIPFKDNSFFLVDASLHPGTSGSPVFTIPKGIQAKKDGSVEIGSGLKVFFLGVNSGEFGDMKLNSIWYSSLIVTLLK